MRDGAFVIHPDSVGAILHLRAPNDASGNPRRVFVVLNRMGGVITAVDEGYDGNGAYRQLFAVAIRRDLHDHGVPYPFEVPVAAAEYHRHLRRIYG